MTEVLLVLLGAALGYAAGWLQQTVDRARRRKAAATALMAEWVRVQQSLEYLRDRWRGGAAVLKFATPMFDRVPDLVELFGPITVARLMDLIGFQAELRRMLEFFPEVQELNQRQRYVAELKDFVGNVLGKGGLALESLQEEGGEALQMQPLPTLERRDKPTL